jgi:hypothetical protein
VEGRVGRGCCCEGGVVWVVIMCWLRVGSEVGFLMYLLSLLYSTHRPI